MTGTNNLPVISIDQLHTHNVTCDTTLSLPSLTFIIGVYPYCLLTGNTYSFCYALFHSASSTLYECDRSRMLYILKFIDDQILLS